MSSSDEGGDETPAGKSAAVRVSQSARLRKRERRRRYRKMMIRVVRRQILMSNYRKDLLRQFKVTSAMILKLEGD